MFSTTSSPQTAPATPSSSSNNSDEPQSSGLEWPYHPQGYPNESAHGVSGEDGYCSMPLGDLINESNISTSANVLLRNSPLPAPSTLHITPSVWPNRAAQNPSHSYQAPFHPYSTSESNTYSSANSQSNQALCSYVGDLETKSFPPEAFGLSNPSGIVVNPTIGTGPAPSQPQTQPNAGSNGGMFRSIDSYSRLGIKQGGESNLQISDSAYSLRLRVHDVPKKSRVETQVKLKLELVDVSQSSADIDSIGGGVGISGITGANGNGVPVKKWSYVKVPKTASVKMRNKGVCEPDPSTVLSLSASIYCATNPSWVDKRVPCCEPCQSRERKRNSKKVINGGSFNSNVATKSEISSREASRNPTPATSDAEGGLWGNPHGRNGSNSAEAMETDGYVSPIDFTCYHMLDCSSGTVPLSFRVVCYCRHYREKVGFCIVLTLRDNFGTVVGEVKTSPIMITDDHKSVQKLTPAHTADEEEADTYSSSKRRTKRIISERVKVEEEDDDFPVRGGSGLSRDQGTIRESGIGAIRNRHRSNRLSGLSKSSTGISKPSSTSAGSENASCSGTSGPPMATTTNIYRHDSTSRGNQSYTQSESPLATTAPSSPSVGFSPPPSRHGDGNKSEVDWLPIFPPPGFGDGVNSLPMTSMNITSPTTSVPPQPLPVPVLAPNPYPNITRVIPSSGSMLGGIEVTLFGDNFSREALTNAGVAFGPNIVPFASGSSLHVWSETVLICTLPPSAMPGPVEVKLLGVGTGGQETQAPVFTYVEEGDKDLMMQALQILGWQSSGRWQDPRNVAMNILSAGTPGQSMMMDTSMGADFSSLINGLSTSRTPIAQRPLKKVEELVLNVLRSAQHPVTGVIGHISAPNPVTGQTLLHIASALGYSKLVYALIGWGAKVDLQDKNGFSPAHCAGFYGQLECLEILVRIGRAHLEGRDVQGRSPLDVCSPHIKDAVLELEEEVETRRRRSRAPSEVESGGEGDDEGISWSEADGDDEDDNASLSRGSGSGPPRPVSRRISRVSSVASISSNRKTSRSTTPFAAEPLMTPVPSSPTRPLSPGSTWSLPRNIPVPWPMQLPAGWQLPNVQVPAMPQFARRRTGAPRSPGSQKNEKETEKMFKWMMWMDVVLSQWGMLQAQQQQQDLDNDPPPKYSPAVSGPPQEKQAVSTSLGTPVMPTTLEEPPSPLSLDLPYSTPVPASVSATHSHASPNIRHRHQLPSHRRRSEFSDTTNNPMHVPSSKAIKRREKKQQDKMLYYFWIPVLALALLWASYKFLVMLYHLVRSAPSVGSMTLRAASITA